MIHLFLILQCIDVNECDDPKACGPNAICTNVAGGKQCTCPPGFQGDAYLTGCYDIDECASRTLPCGRDALCGNLEGTFRCTCPPGFIGDPHVACTGIFRVISRSGIGWFSYLWR